MGPTIWELANKMSTNELSGIWQVSEYRRRDSPNSLDDAQSPKEFSGLRPAASGVQLVRKRLYRRAEARSARREVGEDDVDGLEDGRRGGREEGEDAIADDFKKEGQLRDDEVEGGCVVRMTVLLRARLGWWSFFIFGHEQRSIVTRV